MNLFPRSDYKAALYYRLSRDEDSKQESNSITNQRRILTEYAQTNGFPIAGEYVDDGVSGTSFDRPGFQRMMEDIKAGKINMVITKDLSRLEREYIQTGQYIEKIFPELGVRYIAVGDGYDGLFENERSADMVPMINFFNEFHAKQSSKKSRASKRSMAAAGQFIGTKAPFGYSIDPQNKHHLLVDEEAAETVRLIFRYACDGLGFKAISKRLRDANILNPSAYNNIKFPTFHKSEYWRQPHDWHPSSIKTILTNPTYLGKTVSGRRTTKSFKCKDIVHVPEENWIVVEGMHEPLIDQQTWETAQQKLAVRKRSDNQGAIQMFAGLLKCADCGYALAYSGYQGNAQFQCSLYNVKGKGYCKSHYIKYDDLYEIVFHDIQRRAKAAANMDEYHLNQLSHTAAGLLGKRARQAEKDCKKFSDRVDELETVIGRLYEDSALGRISPERFASLLSKYEAEQKSLKEKRDTLEAAIAKQEKQLSESEQFLAILHKYKDITELDAVMLNELIDHIEVGSKETVDGVKRQTVRIIYRQVCYVAMEEFEDIFPLPEKFDAENLQLMREAEAQFGEKLGEDKVRRAG